MTVEAYTPPALYTISGTGPYAFNHAFRAAEDMEVSVVEGFTVTTLTGGAYSVTPDGASAGGTVTLSAATAATHAGKALRIDRDTAKEQGFVGATSREMGMERQLDIMVMAIQENAARTGSIAQAAANAAQATASAGAAAASAGSAAASSAAAGAASGRLDVGSLAELATKFTYGAPGVGQQQVAAGDVILWRATGIAFQVLDDGSGNPDFDYTGSGGVKLRVLKSANGGYPLPAFGCDLTNSAVNDDAAFARAVARHQTDPNSFIDHTGGFLTLSATSQLGTIRMRGVGFRNAARYAFANAAYGSDANFSGSIIRITGTTGDGLYLGASTGGYYGVEMSDVLIIGPGTGTGQAMRLQNVLWPIFRNVGIVNFPVGTHWNFTIGGYYDACKWWGNQIALKSDTSGNNANRSIGHDFIANNEDIVATRGNQNTFHHGIFENTRDNVITLDTSGGTVIDGWSFRHNWFEGDGDGLGGIILTGDLLKFVGGNDIEDIDFSYNRMNEAGSFALLGGTNNRGHKFIGNRAKSISVSPVDITIPSGMVGATVMRNVAITTADNSRAAFIEAERSFTGTLTGIDETVTGTFEWNREGKIVTLDMPSLLGTSNAVTMTVTGLPNDISPSGGETNWMTCRVQDNGTDSFGIVRVTSGNVLQFQLGAGGTVFTASGGKGLRAGQITYSIKI